MSDIECYCRNCGVEHTESLMELNCPTCGIDTTFNPPFYYECQHGVRYGDQDSDCDWSGKDRECLCV